MSDCVHVSRAVPGLTTADGSDTPLAETRNGILRKKPVYGQC
jgi:hypothetical protein